MSSRKRKQRQLNRGSFSLFYLLPNKVQNSGLSFARQFTLDTIDQNPVQTRVIDFGFDIEFTELPRKFEFTDKSVQCFSYSSFR
jgi:hypothetical protein